MVKVSIPLKRAIQSTFFFLMIVSILLIWPIKAIRPWQYVGDINRDSTKIVLNDGTIMQEFTAQMYGLSYISFYVFNEEKEEVQEGILVFRLFDSGLQKLEEREISLKKLSIPGECRVRIGSELRVGETYYFTIENPGTELLFSMEDGYNLDVKYEYKALFNKLQYALCALAVFCIGALGMLVIELLLRKSSCYVKYDFGFRLGAAIMCTALSLWGMWNLFPLKKFTDNWIDILFYEVGILLFLTVTLYGLLHKREKADRTEILWCSIRDRIPNILQSGAFAGVMLGGVRYLNAMNSYEQKLASNIVLCWFGLAIICSYSKKEVLNWYNVVYLIMAVCVGVSYCLQNRTDPETWEIAKGNALVWIVWGIIILNTIRIFIEKKKNKVSLGYFVGLIILLEEMIRNRNTREWPIVIAVFWGLFALRIICKGGIAKYLNNLSNGVFLHFIGISIYAMLYRPFHKYIYTRYAGIFFTVTMAAVYDVFVLVLSLIRFLVVYRKKGSLKEAWKELCLMGMASGFLLLTLSRTGLITAIILCLLVLVVTTVFEYKDGIKGALKRVGIFLVTALCFFPIVFTACRMVPAVVSKPSHYDIEMFIGSIRAGEEWDSKWFITVPYFFGVADAKLSYYSSEEAITEEQAGLGATADYSNGRLSVYKAYLRQLNWTGHDAVGIKMDDGSEAMHAHDVFIQVAHDFGIGTGVLFILICCWAGIRSIRFYLCHKEEMVGAVPAAILGVFGVCGLAEWVFIPYLPVGFAFLFTLVLLTLTETKGEEI